MRIIFTVVLVLLAVPLFATVEGYKDIYLDREKPINIHSIYCGANLQNIRALKNSYIYTNSERIEEGTYYFSSAYGDFSYTFKPVQGQDPKQLLSRGLLTAGKTNKSEMVIELCIVGNIPGIPAQLSKSIGKTTLSVEGPEWDAMMVKLAMFGKPAFGEGVYVDQRTTSKYDAKNKAVYDANQAYIVRAKELFKAKFEVITSSLPKQLEDGIKYAYQEDGFLATKTYPVVKEPTVWTPISKERYDDQQRRLAQEMAWDQVIQKNFDWFFKLTTKGNALKSVTPSETSDVKINGRVIEQTSTLSALFEDGKTLKLEFLISSEALPREVFASLADIKKEADSVRGSAVAGSRETRAPVEPPSEIDVYSTAEKMVIFFSPFREKSLGDTYSYE